MSATKNLLQDWEDSQQQLDQALYQAQAGMAFMANTCWMGDDCDPYHAPEQEWISETRTQLMELVAWLQEMQAARTILDEETV